MPGPASLLADTQSLEIVGRDEELVQLHGFLERIRSSPGVLLLEGEPGVGKTTVWRAGIEAARDRSIRVLAASPTEAEVQMSFAALDDLLAGAVEEAFSALPTPQRRALEIALLLADADEAPPSERAVAAAFLNTLRALSGTTPALVAIDDVQWLDASSARVLGYALRRLREEHIGALLARRTEDVPTRPSEIEKSLRSDNTTSLPLGPLTTGALHKLVRARLGFVLPRPILRRVHETSSGNPFYALELVRALEREQPDLSASRSLPVPPTLNELLRDRIDSVPAETQRALLYAASGSNPQVSTLTLALASDARAALAPAVDAHLVALDGDRVRFLHPLLADAAYATADGRARRDVHVRLARATSDSEERARHLALGADGPDEAVASALERAAARARARGASAAAAQLCEQARALTPPTGDDARQRRTLASAWYWFAAGDTARAHQLLEDALEAAPPGARRAEAMTNLGRLAITEGDQPGAADLLQRALVEARDDEAVRAEAAQSFATALFFMREELETAREYEQIAVDLAKRTGNVPLYVNALATRGLVEALLGLPEAEATLEAALEDDTSPGERVIAWPSYHQAYFHVWADEPGRAAVALRSFVDEAAARGDESSLPTILSSLSHATFLVGRWDDALRHAEDAHELSLQVGQRHQQAWSLSARALVLASLGVEDRARRDAADALAIAGERSMGVARIHAVWALGLLDLSLDRPDDAARVLAPIREQLIDAGVREPGSMRFVPDEVEAHITRGRLTEAEGPLAWLEEQGHALGRASALGAAARCRGLVFSTTGDLERAQAAFEDALFQIDRVPIPFETARTLLAFGSTQRRAKRKSEARATLERARSLFEELGAAIWEAKARAELARIGGRAPSRNELTPSEQRVAELVSEGKTNKEVAATLFVSARTVEFHLSHIYRKLGVRSRSELARTFRE